MQVVDSTPGTGDDLRPAGVRAAATEPSHARVPQPPGVVWGVKLLPTRVGEAASDALVRTVGAPAVPAGVLVTAALVAVAIRSRRYSPVRYWLAALAVAVSGTMVADVVHVVLGVAYATSATVFVLLLAGAFVAWALTERTVSIHSITTGRRAAFYWLVVVLTFAFGTALGDLTATTLLLGYGPSILLFAIAVAIVAVLRVPRLLPVVPAFWTAYVLTRPLGSSIADSLGSAAHGGLGLGSQHVAIVGVAAFLLLLVCISAAAGRIQRIRSRAGRILRGF